jgi:chromosome segregation ATPase
MIIIFLIMALIFVRQIMIYKQPLKINYAPILIALGAIGTLTHILSNPTNENFIFVFRESLLPLFVGFILFIIMNIMSQNQKREFEKSHLERDSHMHDEIVFLKDYISALEKRMILNSQNIGSATEQELEQIFEKDIEALNTIQNNQSLFLAKFEQMLEEQHKAVEKFDDFSQKDFVELDKMMHRHIETVRHEQKLYFEKIESKPQQSSVDFDTKVLDNITDEVKTVKTSIEKLSKNIITSVSNDLRETLGEFEGQFSILRTQTRGITTNIKDSESIIDNIRVENDKLLNKITYTMSHLDEVINRSREIENMYSPISSIMQSANEVKNDYLKALKSMDSLSAKLNDVDMEHYKALQSNIDSLSYELSQKIDDSLKALQEHFHIAQNTASPTMKELSQKSQTNTTPSQIKAKQAYSSES